LKIQGTHAEIHSERGFKGETQCPPMDAKFIVESDVIIRAVDKPFPQRQALGLFLSADAAYQYIEKYIADTKELHTYYSRSSLCSKDDFDTFIANERMVAMNIVLGQFEDMIYVRKLDS